MADFKASILKCFLSTYWFTLFRLRIIRNLPESFFSLMKMLETKSPDWWLACVHFVVQVEQVLVLNCISDSENLYSFWIFSCWGLSMNSTPNPLVIFKMCGSEVKSFHVSTHSDTLPALKAPCCMWNWACVKYSPTVSEVVSLGSFPSVTAAEASSPDRDLWSSCGLESNWTVLSSCTLSILCIHEDLSWYVYGGLELDSPKNGPLVAPLGW